MYASASADLFLSLIGSGNKLIDTINYFLIFQLPYNLDVLYICIPLKFPK